MNKLLKGIEEIRGIIETGASMEEVYNSMIDLNRIDVRVDDYTCYYMDSIDLGHEYSKIMVEDMFGGYLEATMEDIKVTLNELEYYLIDEKGIY